MSRGPRKEAPTYKEFCPFCGTKVYETEDTANAKLAGKNALSLHIPRCAENPKREKSEMDEFMDDIFKRNE